MTFLTKRRTAMLLVDISVMLLAGLLAAALRDNLEFSTERITAGWVYHAAVLGASVCIVPLVGLDRSIWRFSSLNDYLMVVVTCFFIIAAASLMTLLASRFEGVARSIPIIHFVVATFALVSLRVAFRKKHDLRRLRHSQSSFNDLAQEPHHHVNVLVVGLNRLAEAYIEAVAEFASERIRVVGLVGDRGRHVGRLIATHPVLGVVEDIETIVRDLEPHGTTIDRIVIACDFDGLSQEARRMLLRLEQSGDCELQMFAEQLKIVKRDEAKPGTTDLSATHEKSDAQMRFAFPASEVAAMRRRPYWSAKRLFDATAAALLIMLLGPLIIATAVFVGLFIGFPVAFWQQRPGLGGVPFRLYKFRTMRPAHDLSGRHLTDEERLSPVGVFLRRYRLDELPQLFNILIGDMSFIGPRPLLPRDQAPEDRARLLVRPGLTGWAQVVGGRDISADDKAALDIWYVKNASLSLDMQIALRTVPLVIVGEKIHRSQIEHAWRELRKDGILSN